MADTNVYVGATNDPGFRSRFEAFVSAHGPLLVSAVVVAEVLIGVPNAVHQASATHAVAAGSRILAPVDEDWLVAGAALARLGGDAVTKGRSFWNDALLGAQCARLGATLVTHNAADFRRLRRWIGVRAVPPFPSR